MIQHFLSNRCLALRSTSKRFCLSKYASASSAVVLEQPVQSIPVKAYYVAKGIDIIKISGNLYQSKKQSFQTKAIVVTIDEEKEQYLSVFKYGSVVFFNIPESQHNDHLHAIRSTASSSAISESLQHTEQYKMYVNDNLEKASVLKKSDHLVIRKLDSTNLQIVGAIMAQTVALDYYAVAVERMIDTFMRMNVQVEETGNFKQLDSNKLFKLIASNNTVVTNVISKMGIFEGSDAAWEDSDVWNTWEGLRKDFEIDHRYKDLSLKLEIVKDNTRFFLEMVHNNKSMRVEWIIIYFIGVEIIIGVAELCATYGLLPSALHA